LFKFGEIELVSVKDLELASCQGHNHEPAFRTMVE